MRPQLVTMHNKPQSLENLPDEELMLLVKEGKDEAFQYLIERFRVSLYRFIYRMFPDEAYAEDIFQETFLRIYKSAHRYVPTAKFSTYAYKIATNLCINEIKKKKRRYAVPLAEEHGGAEEQEKYGSGHVLPDERDTPDTMYGRSEDIQAVRAALEELPEHQRAVLILSFYEGLPYEEIAEMLQCSPGTVKSRVHRAKKAIAAYMKRHGLL